MVRYIAVIEETTYHDDTLVPNKYFHFLSESVTPDTGLVFPEIATYKDYYYVVSTKFGNSGSLEFVGDTAGIGYFLKWALGEVTTTQPDATNAPNTYLHTFTPTEEALPSFALEIGGDITARRIFGCKVNSFTFEAPLGDVVTYSVDIVGGKETLVSLSSPTTFENPPPFLVFHQGVITIDGTTSGDVKAFSLTVSNDLRLDDAYRLAGDKYPKLLYEGRRTIEVSLDVVFRSTTLYQKFLDSSVSSIEVTFDTGEEIDTGYTKKLTITLPKVFYTAGTPSISGRDEIVCSMTGRAVVDETAGYALKIELQNAISSY